MLLYILLTIAVLFILAQTYVMYIFVNRINELHEDYNELDKGMAEVTDAYYTDSLQYEEAVENLREAKLDLQRRNDEQAATIDGLRRANDEYFQENTGLRRKLEIAQLIISEHDAHCLPHIILKSMPDTEQDTPLPI